MNFFDSYLNYSLERGEILIFKNYIACVIILIIVITP